MDSVYIVYAHGSGIVSVHYDEDDANKAAQASNEGLETRTFASVETWEIS